ncbi:glycosyl hydrolase family 76 [Pedobacter polaris]|uniref:Glycosyl hydrolase family 76 n=1 Tax=Pedobacter polaris TaxID=2571273 RepID=A0A4U1CPA1_9SPHI|nr:glycoside hydrolase family 76 protein [Pedobacter polaris]TKC09877.1 glycosyl hydrolase family 76 [Pedobacter polaris]
MKNTKIGIVLFGVASAITLLSSCLKDESFPLYPGKEVVTVNYNWSLTADSLQDKLTSSYLSANGKYYKADNAGSTVFNYWPNAHVMDVLNDGFVRTKNDVYKQRMVSLLAGIRETNGNTLSNNFYDDMEWLSLSTLRAYQTTGDVNFLNAAKVLWTDIKTGRNNIQGDGIAWRKTQLYYKNTPANAPAIIFAARLYQLEKDAADLQIAKELYTWLKGKLIDPASGIAWDGVNANQNGEIDKNLYTYNQGVFVGAGLELYKATGEIAYLNDAMRTANATMKNLSLSPGGLLKNEGQGDGGLFKGILVRYFTLLVQEPVLYKTDKDALVTFLKFNAQTLYTQGIARPALSINSDWKSKPSASADLTTQLSGMMMLEAASTLNALKLF